MAMEAEALMRAWVRDRDGEGGVAPVEADVPEARPGWVLVRVQAFGVSADDLRAADESAQAASGAGGQAGAAAGQAGAAAGRGRIPGMQCAGEVVDGGGTNFAPGMRAVCLGGQLGRELDGAWARYVLAPARQVKAVPDDLEWTWAQLGAACSMWSAAWGALFDCLDLAEGDKLLVRGRDCGLARVAGRLAHAAGAKVLACAQSTDEVSGLLDAGADAVLPDVEGDLSAGVPPVGKVLDLVGPARLRDTLRLAAAGGAVCTVACQGGARTLDAFDPLADIPNGVRLSAFDPRFPTQRAFDALFAFCMEHGLAPALDAEVPAGELPRALERLAGDPDATIAAVW